MLVKIVEDYYYRGYLIQRLGLTGVYFLVKDDFIIAFDYDKNKLENIVDNINE